MTPYPKEDPMSDIGDGSTMNEGYGQSGLEGSLTGLRDQARVMLDGLTKQVQEHPLRTLAIVGGIGFVLASSMRRGVLPAMLKSGIGVAAAVAFRQAATRGLAGMWSPEASTFRPD